MDVHYPLPSQTHIEPSKQR